MPSVWSTIAQQNPWFSSSFSRELLNYFELRQLAAVFHARYSAGVNKQQISILLTVVILRFVAAQGPLLSIDDPLYPQHGTVRDVRFWPLADIDYCTAHVRF
jgi:hypothetical protein